MATRVILPKLGQTMEEGTIVEWLKREGEPVDRGEVLFQVESDKAVLEVESRAKGVLRRILVGKGAKTPVLTVVGIIAAPDEDISGLLSEAGESSAQPEPTQAGAETLVPTAGKVAASPAAAEPLKGEPGYARVLASPRARKLAREKAVDLWLITGTGPGGRITEKDVLAFLERQPAATPLARKMAREMELPLERVPTEGARITAAVVRAAAEAQAPPITIPGEGEVVPMSGIRAITAERMAASAHTSAPVTLQSMVDATEFVALRNKLKEALAEELGFSISYNDLLALIVARCLVEFPYMNVRLEEAGIRRLNEVNVGIAVDGERGLIVPVIRNADKMGLGEMARRSRDLVIRTREGRTLPDELSGGTFTITNMGMLGVDMFTPIINLPECAILGVGRIRPEAMVVDGNVLVRQRMWLSLTFDHRLVDGGPAARFLQAIMRYIETPGLLLV